jgi:REP element-mobilizing transposase RayT
MPDHVHLLLTLDRDVSIEKAMQLIKGGYSYRLRKELGYAGETGSGDFPRSESTNGQVSLLIGITFIATRLKRDWSILRRSFPIAHFI